MKATKFFIIAATVGAVLTGCSKDKPEIEPKLKVGQAYQGGIIAFIDATGEHGLIAAPEDQNNGNPIKWWNGYYKNTEARFTHIGGGKDNTDKIVEAQGTGNYAANLCKSLNLGGYTDWFLPSIDELYELYRNRVVIGGFSSAAYWSSFEYDSDNAYYKNFSHGTQFYTDKSYNCRVRAVRYF